MSKNMSSSLDKLDLKLDMKLNMKMALQCIIHGYYKKFELYKNLFLT